MKISCEKAVLSESLNTCYRAIPSKSTIPALEGFLIDCTGQPMVIGSSLEMTIKAPLPTQVLQPGAIVLTARLFFDIVKNLSDDMVTIEVDDRLMTTISCGAAVYNLIGMNKDDYPEIPVFDGDRTIELPQGAFKSMISKTIHAVSVNDTKIVLTGSLFEVSGKRFRIVATDSFRLAIRQEDLQKDAEDHYSFIVPGQAQKEIARLLRDTGADPAQDQDAQNIVRISSGKKHVMFEFGGALLISRLLEGEFLNYEKILPREFKFSALCQAEDIQASIERVSLIVSESIKSPVVFLFDDNILKLRCQTALGKAYDECKISGDGEGLEIGFNSRYMLDALKACDSGKISMRFISGISPCVITGTEDDRFLHLISPVRIRNSND